MNDVPFIFSTNTKYKITRHGAFWIASLFGQGLLQLGVRPLFNVAISHNMLMEFMLLPILYLPGQLLLVYSVLYFVIPRYVLHAEYKNALIWLVLLTFVSAFTAELSYAFFNYPFRQAFMEPVVHSGEVAHVVNPMMPGINWENFPFDFVFGLRAVINVGGFAAAIKLMKHWYEKEYRNTTLQKEKLNAELKSLKAQIHPHFLFNTLNNIYSIAEKSSPLASDIILRLSNLLRYILYECNAPTVLLVQEWKLIEDYIALEKLRYGNLDIQVRLPSNSNSYRVAPLLLLPLVENCFKHGTSQVLEVPWININADINTDVLSIKFVNGKSVNENGNTGGIGLENLKMRLKMLYPNQHEFYTAEEEGVFVAILKINLNSSVLSENK